MFASNIIICSCLFTKVSSSSTKNRISRNKLASLQADKIFQVEKMGNDRA